MRIVSAPDAPAVDIDRPWVIEVLGSPIATIVNASKGITYEPGSYPSTSQGATRWANVMAQASVGDTLEVSPGAIQQIGETGNYWNGLDSCILAVYRAVNIKNMAGRGRWTLYPDNSLMASTKCGINIFSPDEVIDPGRASITIEGFQFDNWGKSGGSNGLKVRTNYNETHTWNDYHASITLKNFKIGKPPYERSGSGLAGAAEILTIEDGHIYDTGAGEGSADGQDHNAYISARTMTIRGVRFQRSRGNAARGWWEGGSDMDGHMLKASAVTAMIEGCVFEADPIYGDNSVHAQFKAGGNIIVRGCLFVGSVHTQNEGSGMIVMCREWSASGLTPNFEPWWDAYRSGNSLLVEKCVFVSHYGKPLVFFFPVGAENTGYMAPGTGANQISSVIVRDNIGMVTPTPTALAPFSSSKWIRNDPKAGPPWSTNNSEMNYAADEPGFVDKPLKGYRRTAGPMPATAGTVATYRFQYPHGYVPRSDANRGLG